ncbi:hypothetical protein [Polymorphospora lycopeni]|uniref:DUF1877 family protein n=1 Tax=Polymorphospora lycopeni TaxID=3140240 RepID=A0ABV5CP00_9ACTN
MSMWLMPAKVSPELLATLRAQPALAEGMFHDPDESLAGFDEDRDLFGTDYRILSEVAGVVWEEDPGSAEQRSWLFYAVHGSDDVLDVEIGYRQPSVLGTAEVARIAAELTGAGPDADGAVGEPAEAVADDERNIGGFLFAAAREGKALVLAIT